MKEREKKRLIVYTRRALAIIWTHVTVVFVVLGIVCTGSESELEGK